jgi:Inward rectifier potassium channel C-terminal domain
VNVVTAIESFSGLVGFALLTGLIFARFAKPTARILFSRPAVVTEFEGVPTLMFRAANERGNQILEAEVSLNLVRNTRTKEGAFIRRFEELGVLRSRSPLFALSWTVMHPIDRNSPLRGLDAGELQRQSAELAVTISGIDQVFAQKIYRPPHLRGERHFVGSPVRRHSFHAAGRHPDRRLWPLPRRATRRGAELPGKIGATKGKPRRSGAHPCMQRFP